MQVVDSNGFLKVRLSGASDGITIGTTAITSGTVGRVLFQGTGNVVSQSANLFWDATNNRLGVGTSSPLGILHLKETAAATRMVMDGDAGQSKIITFRTNGLQRFGFYLNNIAESGGNAGSNFAVRAYNDAGSLLSTPLYIHRNSGNIGVKTTTDAGFGFDVNGTARVQGNAQFGTGFYWDNTNGRLGIGTSSPAHTFQVYRNTSAGYLASFNSGATLNTNASLTVRIENANLPSVQGLSAGAGGFNTFALNPLGGNVLINTTTDAGFKLDVNGTARVSGQISSGITGTNGSIGLRRTSDGSIVGSFYTDAAQTIVKEHTGTGGVLLNGFDTTSLKWVGSSSQPRVGIGFNGTINATCHIKGAFATSATSSLLIENSAGTAAMRVRDDLVILLPNLPTTSAGLPTGAIYNNLGILTIV